MKPVGIFQHSRLGHPGAILDILENNGIPVRLMRIMDGASVPTSPEEFSGLVFMGGYQSVHDRHPWIEQEIALIRAADEAGLAVAGHCLGSQLLARAFGAMVGKNRLKEIGWSRIDVSDVPQACEWLGVPARSQFQTFQWHSDTFEIPNGAIRLATSAHCANQAFVLKERHIAIQSHLEMTPQLIHDSIETNGEQISAEKAALNPAVETVDAILADLPNRTARMHEILSHVYRRWTEGVRR
jgi:GMP synthase-like glutamine amidotransferase